MNLEDLEKIDSHKMYQTYDKWPNIAKQGYEQEFSVPEFKSIDHIVFAGMGGSGTIGDIISSILSKNDVHTSVVKGYSLPKSVDSNTFLLKHLNPPVKSIIGTLVIILAYQFAK